MISNARSAEEWLTEVDQIIRTYQTAHPRSSIYSARQVAIKRLKDLGLTEGDALRYLHGKGVVPAEAQRTPTVRG